MTSTDRVIKFYAQFEKLIVLVLLVLLAIIVTWGTCLMASEILRGVAHRLAGGPQLSREVVREFFDRFYLLREVFGGFMLLLIGLELMKTVVTYLDHNVLHEEVVFTVAIIAVARHAISVDLTEIPPLSLIGIGVLILGLTLGYFYFRKASGTADGGRKGRD